MCCILNAGERKPDAPRFYSHLWYLLIVFIPFPFFLCYPFCCSLEMRPNRKGLDKNHKAQLGSPTQLPSAENEVANRWPNSRPKKKKNRWPNLKAELAESLEAVLLARYQKGKKVACISVQVEVKSYY